MFENVIGQNKIKTILCSQITNGKIPHAYIFVGQNGIGKRFTAAEFAKILNCTTNDFTKTDRGACGKCLNCKKISANEHPDFHIIDFEKQAELRKEDVEKQKILRIETVRYMQKEVLTKAHEAKRKIFIIDPAEKMNSAAANCLLKTLEEPPENTIFILIARQKETILQTILSRCQCLFFQPINQDQIENYLMINHSLNFQEAKRIASISEGSLEEAENIISHKNEDGISLWLELKSKDMNIYEILEMSKSFSRDKDKAVECIDAMTAQAKNDFRAYPKIAADSLELLIKSKSLILRNINTQTVLDNLFFGLKEIKDNSNTLKI